MSLFRLAKTSRRSFRRVRPHWRLQPAVERLEDRTLPSFNAAIDYPVGPQPHGIAVGDFNGDGKPDLATANFYFNPNTVSILLNNGDGTFQPAVNYTVPGAPEDVKVGDFNGDGKLDLAVASSGNTASILLGNGNGTFQPAVNYPAGHQPYRLTTGDFNGDGKLDLAVADAGCCGGTGAVSILLGNGNGTFLTGASYTTPVGTWGIAVGDFNGDGKQDLVATNTGTSDQVYIFLGNGNGTFQSPIHFSSATGNAFPDGVIVADINGDGKADLAIANYHGNAVSLLFGNGNGTFSSSVNYFVVNSPYSHYTGNLALADVNGDGKPDLAVVDAGACVWVLPGNGDGTFRSGVSYATGDGTQSVAVADFNGDGKPDLATANIGGHCVTVLLARPDNTFPVASTAATAYTVVDVATGDFNGDGNADLVTVNSHKSSVSALLSNGNGTFQAPINYATGNGFGAVAVGDLNGDGKADIVTANFYSNSVSVLLGNGNGTFKAAANFLVDVGPEGLALADFNGDGKLDIGTSNFTGRSESVLLGNGNGTFLAVRSESTNFSSVALAVGDFNSDGKTDLALVDYSDSNIEMMLGNGNGTFAAPTNIASATAPHRVVVGDFNGDGKADLAVANEGNGDTGAGVSVLLGNGNGTFKPGVLYRAGEFPNGLAIGDFNGDGRQDLAVDNAFSADVGILLNNGDGTFQAATDYVSGNSYPYAITVGDFNGDHAPDVAAGSAAGDVVSFVFNQPAATHLQVAVSSGAAAGTPVSVTVTALSNFGGPVQSYAGTIHFSSTDSQAGLPADYTFTSADAGVHTFSNGVLLKTAGNQTVTATDTVNAALSGTAVVPVSAAAAAVLSVIAPGGSTAGAPFTVTVTALDAYGNVATGYGGTIHFSSSDSLAGLPVDYTFTASDAGVHTFANQITLQTAGSQTVTATDTSTPWIGNGGTLGGQTITAHHKTSALISGIATVVVSTPARWSDREGIAVALVDAYFAGDDWHNGVGQRRGS
jgi:hypothetical protein